MLTYEALISHLRPNVSWEFHAVREFIDPLLSERVPAGCLRLSGENDALLLSIIDLRPIIVDN